MGLITMPDRAIPIVGQLIEIHGWTLVLQVRCKCEQTGFVALLVSQTPTGRGTGVGQCPSCARPMQVTQIQMNPQGQLEFSVEVGEPPRPGQAS